MKRLLFVSLLLASTASAATEYTYTTLGSVYTLPSDINNKGQIVGQVGGRGGGIIQSGFLYGNGTFTIIDAPVPGTNITNARGINDLGQIVGTYGPEIGPYHGFLLSGNTFTTIDFPGAYATYVVGINNGGQIIGTYTTASSANNSFLYWNGAFATIVPPGNVSSINDLGQIVGPASSRQIYVLSNGRYTIIDFPVEAVGASGQVNIADIDNTGQISGSYRDQNGRNHGFLLSEGVVTTIDVPGSNDNGAGRLNDAGQIVGSYRVANGGLFGFLAEPVVSVNSEVSLQPLPETYRTIADVSACPAGFVGTFSFTAVLTNTSTTPLQAMSMRLASLTNGNVLLDPQTDGITGGVGSYIEVPGARQYQDGTLSQDESVEIPWTVCLTAFDRFELFVNVFGRRSK